jgi:hypothetical protein
MAPPHRCWKVPFLAFRHVDRKLSFELCLAVLTVFIPSHSCVEKNLSKSVVPYSPSIQFIISVIQVDTTPPGPPLPPLRRLELLEFTVRHPRLSYVSKTECCCWGGMGSCLPNMHCKESIVILDTWIQTLWCKQGTRVPGNEHFLSYSRLRMRCN